MWSTLLTWKKEDNWIRHKRRAWSSAFAFASTVWVRQTRVVDIKCNYQRHGRTNKITRFTFGGCVILHPASLRFDADDNVALRRLAYQTCSVPLKHFAPLLLLLRLQFDKTDSWCTHTSAKAIVQVADASSCYSPGRWGKICSITAAYDSGSDSWSRQRIYIRSIASEIAVTDATLTRHLRRLP